MRTAKRCGAAAAAIVSLLGCSAGTAPDASKEVGASVLELREADTVLGFEASDAWSVSDGLVQASTVHMQGAAALAVDVVDRVSLFGAPFKFEKTPNQLTLAVQRIGSAPATAAGRLSIYMGCAGREAERELVGDASLREVSERSFSQVRIAVPAALQNELAGGCERVALELELASDAPVTYVLDGLSLRAPTPEIEQVTDRLCGIPGNQELARTAVETPAGYLDYQAWMAEEATQAEFPLLEAALAPFADVALGPAIDHVNQQVVIPVDASELKAGRVLAALEQSEIALPLRIQQACHPVADLLAADEKVNARDWHAQARTVGMTSYMDAALGQLVVTLDDGLDLELIGTEQSGSGSAGALAEGETNTAILPVQRSAEHLAIAAALEQQLGSLVRVEWGPVLRLSGTRTNDVSPHYGAAAILGPDPVQIGRGMNCTAGPIVRFGAVLGAVTCGHCSAEGGQIQNGGRVYGRARGRMFPAYDMIRIDPSGGTFTRTFYTDPGAPVTRTQTGKANAAMGNLVCSSGAVTKAKCSIEVIAVNRTFCGPDGNCTNHLTRGRRTDIRHTHGDSGAPIYSASGANGATIRGMLTGGVGANFDPVWHTQSDLEGQLGVSIAIN